MINKEITSGNLASQTLTVSASFKRADGSTATVSGTVEVFANGEHEVNISSADILRLKMTMPEFEAASNAMSRAALGVINLTQHAATSEQVEAGVVEPAEKGAVQAALTFDAIPTASEMAERAAVIARIAVDSGCNKAMIGGAPFFMSALEKALLSANIQPIYAFSVRESVERIDGEGNVIKTNVFKHVGFVKVK